MVITFKTPDAASEAIDEYMEANPEADRAAVEKAVAKFVEYGEYAWIDINLETGEARVVPV